MHDWKISQIYAHPVYEGDEFEYSLGMHQDIIHKPKNKTRNITGVYAVAVLPNGQMQAEVMEREEIDDIRAMSESYKAFKAGKIKSCVWEDHYSEMARKTVIRRLIPRREPILFSWGVSQERVRPIDHGNSATNS